MHLSDPQRLRIEAVSMLGGLADDRDIIGIAAFGDSPRWIVSPSTGDSKRAEAIRSSTAAMPSNDLHTDFGDVFKLVGDYLGQQTPDFFRGYDVSVVVLTDGKPDPVRGKYAGDANALNREEAISRVNKLPAGITLHTIGLGPEVETTFLQGLARSRNGMFVQAGTSTDLAEAFLKVATRIYGLPAYQAAHPGGDLTLHIGPSAARGVLVLFRPDKTSTVLVPGAKVLAESDHILALELRNVSGDLTAKSKGSGRIIFCLDQQLRFEPQVPLPSGQLVDSSIPVGARLLGGNEVVWDKLFLEDAYVQVRFRNREDNFVAPLSAVKDEREFKGGASVATPGIYVVSIELVSPYGAVSTFLGKVEVASSAVFIPQAVPVAIPPVRTLGWLTPTSTQVRFVLPAGSAEVRFSVPEGLRVDPVSAHVEPGKDLVVNFWTDGGKSTTALVPYTITWTDGRNSQSLNLQTTVNFSQLSWGGVLARRRWETFGALVALLATIWLIRRSIRPILKGRLVIEYQGACAADVDLRTLRTKSIEICETAGAYKQSRSHIAVRTGTERSVAVLTHKRIGRKHRWKRVLTPRAPLYIDDRPLTEGPVPEGRPVSLKDKDFKLILY